LRPGYEIKQNINDLLLVIFKKLLTLKYFLLCYSCEVVG